MDEEKICIKVSVGDFFDKISEVEIKLNRTTDVNEKSILQNVFDQLKSQGNEYLQNQPHYYKYIKFANEEIMNLSEKIKTNDDDMEVYKDILYHNERKQRIKNKINKKINHNGENEKKVIFIGHTEFGDQITVNGLIRYLSTCYDKVKITALPNRVKFIEYLYKDDPSIECMVETRLSFNEFLINVNIIEKIKEENKGWEIKSVGLVGNINIFDNNIFFNEFYSQLGMPIDYRFKYNYIPRNKERELEVYNKLIGDKYPYIFEHNKNDRLVVKSDEYYVYSTIEHEDSNDIFLIDFSLIIENAIELHMSDSSFFCLSNYLDLSKVQRLVLYRRGSYDVTKYFNPNQKWELV